MVIQRIQSLYLLIAAVLLGVLCFAIPVDKTFVDGVAVVTRVCSSRMLPLFIISILTLVMSVIDIFLYHNLKRQMKVAKATIALALAVIVVSIISCYRLGGIVSPYIYFYFATALLPVFFVHMALRGMKADYNLLRDTIR